MFDTETAEKKTGDKNVEQFWIRLRQKPDDAQAWESLFSHYRWLVQAELSKARARLPRHIDGEELEVAGQEALFMSVRSFQPERNLHFENYARTRIRGAMIDRLRGLDGLPRTARRAAKTLAHATQNFSKRNGRAPDSAELGSEAGLSGPEVDRLIRQAQLSRKLSLDVFMAGDNIEDGQENQSALRHTVVEEHPLDKMAAAEQQAALVEGLKQLPERERAILVLHYQQGVMFTQIAAGIAVSESRVSQMHARALKRLKEYLTCRHMGKGEEDD